MTATLSVPAITRRAILKAVMAGLSPLKAEPPQPLSTWSAEHFEMDEESSHRSGTWESWPFQVGWMDAFSNDDIEEVDVEKAKRVGYTKTVVAFATYNAAHRRRKQAYWQPTDDDRDSFEKSEIAPAFEKCRAIASVRRAGRDMDTVKFKRFRGSVMHLLGAKAARNFRRITVAVAVMDEIDAMDPVVEKTIDPFTGAKGRLEGAPFPKIIIGTTPRHELTSHIRRRVEAAEAILEYHIPCKHCGVTHPLIWGGSDIQHGFKWDKGQPDTVRHHCPHCHQFITQAEYLAIWDQGRWISRCGNYTYDHHQKIWLDAEGNKRRPPLHVAFVRVWTAYSPQRAWPDIVKEFLEARKCQKAGDSGPMMGFTNETLADTWKEQFEHTDASVLRQRAAAEPPLPLRVVPRGACKLLMGIDTQADRWEAVTWAVGRGREMWPIDYQVIYGSPAKQEEWSAKLDPLINTIYRHVNGASMSLDFIGIDTGGTNWTHQAYNYCRGRSHKNVYATKGEQALGAPIKMKPSWLDVNSMGKILKRGIKLWRICVDTAKDLLHGMLDQIKVPGPGYIHLNPALPPEWFEQLTAEHRIKVRLAHGYGERWVCPSGHRNEVLDCTVIVLLGCEILGLHNQTDATWDMWEKRLEPDLFSNPIQLPAAPAQPLATPAEPAQPPHYYDTTTKPERAKPAPPPTRYRMPSTIASDDWSSRL